MSYFNSNLSYIRKLKKLSQSNLADMIGVDQSTISLWENGMDTTIENAVNVANVLNIPIPEFLGTDMRLGIGETLTIDNKEKLMQVLKDKGILDNNDNISEEDFEKLIKFIDNNKDLLIKKDRD